MRAVQPWKFGTVCQEREYPEFAKALKQASYHFADDSGKEWGASDSYMDAAAKIAADAAWPYWAIKRMYQEIAPLPSFDTFMGVYCKRLLVNAKGGAA